MIKNLDQSRHFILFLTMSILQITPLRAGICPEGSDLKETILSHPISKETIRFNCLNNTRREFIKTSDDSTEKMVATVFNQLNEITGEETLSLNTLNKFIDEKAVQFEKFSQSGTLERLEKYNDQKIVLKYKFFENRFCARPGSLLFSRPPFNP